MRLEKAEARSCVLGRAVKANSPGTITAGLGNMQSTCRGHSSLRSNHRGCFPGPPFPSDPGGDGRAGLIQQDLPRNRERFPGLQSHQEGFGDSPKLKSFSCTFFKKKLYSSWKASGFLLI